MIPAPSAHALAPWTDHPFEGSTAAVFASFDRSRVVVVLAASARAAHFTLPSAAPVGAEYTVVLEDATFDGWVHPHRGSTLNGSSHSARFRAAWQGATFFQLRAGEWWVDFTAPTDLGRLESAINGLESRKLGPGTLPFLASSKAAITLSSAGWTDLEPWEPATYAGPLYAWDPTTGILGFTRAARVLVGYAVELESVTASDQEGRIRIAWDAGFGTFNALDASLASVALVAASGARGHVALSRPIAVDETERIRLQGTCTGDLETVPDQASLWAVELR